MNEPRVVTAIDDYRQAASEARPGVRVPVEVRVRVSDPYLAYRRARNGPGGIFLETTGGQDGWGYFGLEPVDRLTVNPEAVTWDRKGSQAPSLAALEGLLNGERLVRGDCSIPYPCGAVGWLSYDVARELEALPEQAVDDRALPRLEVGLYETLVAWEAPVDGDVTLRITSCPALMGDSGSESGSGPDSEFDTDPDRIIEETYNRARTTALKVAEAVRTGEPERPQPPVRATEATFESDCGREAFADRVRHVKEYIRDGDTFQANISQRLVAPAAISPLAAYDALRGVNPAPYSCLLEFPQVDLISASPELLLERNGEFVRTEPIAGTRPRGETAQEDTALEADLLTDAKERAEHAMLVDLERNDLGKVCAYGSVDVAQYRRVDMYSEVMHLVSNVTGRLRPEATLADAIAAVFPGGTITGAPKPRTMEIIDELEATRRGPYTGSVGIFGFDDRATLNIVIRTLVRHETAYHLRVGAGIVHDSDPYREYEETLDKARALITAVDEALGEQAKMALEVEVETDGGENS